MVDDKWVGKFLEEYTTQTGNDFGTDEHDIITLDPIDISESGFEGKIADEGEELFTLSRNFAEPFGPIIAFDNKRYSDPLRFVAHMETLGEGHFSINLPLTLMSRNYSVDDMHTFVSDLICADGKNVFTQENSKCLQDMTLVVDDGTYINSLDVDSQRLAAQTLINDSELIRGEFEGRDWDPHGYTTSPIVKTVIGGLKTQGINAEIDLGYTYLGLKNKHNVDSWHFATDCGGGSLYLLRSTLPDGSHDWQFVTPGLTGDKYDRYGGDAVGREFFQPYTVYSGFYPSQDDVLGDAAVPSGFMVQDMASVMKGECVDCAKILSAAKGWLPMDESNALARITLGNMRLTQEPYKEVTPPDWLSPKVSSGRIDYIRSSVPQKSSTGEFSL